MAPFNALTGEYEPRPVPGEVEIENWKVPSFTYDLKTTLLHVLNRGNMTIHVDQDTDEAIYESDQGNIHLTSATLDIAGQVLSSTNPPEYEGTWDPITDSQDPDYQIGFIRAVSWRKQTIIEEMKRRVAQEDNRTQNEYIENMSTIDILRAAASGEFPDLVEFTIIQARREDFQHGLFADMLDFMIAELSEIPLSEETYKHQAFASAQEFLQFKEEYATRQNDENLVREIRANISDEQYVDPDKQGDTALQLYSYIKALTSNNLEISTQLIQRFLLCEYDELLPNLLYKLGIPHEPEHINEDTTPDELAKYIAKHFIAMNDTHLGRDGQQ